MKICDRKTFLALPEGTLYSVYEPCVFGKIEIKGDSLANDWFLQSLDNVMADSSDEAISILEEAEIDGRSFRFDLNRESREGMFEESQKYAVWERQDVEALIIRLKKCIK